jgi:hypothetical protein
VPIFLTAAKKEEPQDLMQFMSFSLNSGSRILQADNTMLMPGITILYRFVWDMRSDAPVSEHARMAARTLCKELVQQGMYAMLHGSGVADRLHVEDSEWDSRVPANGVLVKIGPKPDQFFLTETLKKRRAPDALVKMNEARSTPYCE